MDLHGTCLHVVCRLWLYFLCPRLETGNFRIARSSSGTSFCAKTCRPLLSVHCNLLCLDSGILRTSSTTRRRVSYLPDCYNLARWHCVREHLVRVYLYCVYKASVAGKMSSRSAPCFVSRRPFAGDARRCLRTCIVTYMRYLMVLLAGDDCSALGVEGDYDAWATNTLYPVLDTLFPPRDGECSVQYCKSKSKREGCI